LTVVQGKGGAFVDADVRGIVIGSTWRRCSASLAVDESSLAVVDYLLGQHENLLQFAGQKDGATRRAQNVLLLLTNHVDHDVSDPLVAVQLDAFNAFCSVSRQPQFDVLAVRHPVLMTMEGYRFVTNSLDRAPYTNTEVIFFLCRAMPPLCVSVTIRGSLITCPARRGGSRVMI